MKLSNIKVVTFLVAIINCSFSAKGQIEFGAKTGLNISKSYIETGDNISYSPIFNYQIGVYFKKPITEKWSINTELLLQNKGYNAVENWLYTSEKKTAQLTYLSLPIYTMYHFNAGLAALAGFEFGYLLKSDGPYAPWNSEEIRNKADFGLCIGVRQAFLKDFFFEIRYLHGIKNVATDKEPETMFSFPDMEVQYEPYDLKTVEKNRVIQFSLGVKLK